MRDDLDRLMDDLRFAKTELRRARAERDAAGAAYAEADRAVTRWTREIAELDCEFSMFTEPDPEETYA